MASKPLRATKHCRHYSNERSATFFGEPKCALGVDLSAPGISKKCWSHDYADKVSPCPQREEYTERERHAWEAYCQERLVRLGAAILALGEPMKLSSSRTVVCPHCGGKLTATRALNGHVWISCSTDDCLPSTHLNIDRGTEWPQRISANG